MTHGKTCIIEKRNKQVQGDTTQDGRENNHSNTSRCYKLYVRKTVSGHAETADIWNA